MLTVYNNGGFNYSYAYRGEGNAHLALSLKEINKILLIKKHNVSYISNKLDEEKWDDSIDFHNNIMRTLLEPFVSKVCKVQIDSNDIQEVEKLLSSIRPLFRQKNVLSATCVALMNDYTCLEVNNEVYNNLPTMSFEIKPKCAIDIDNKCMFCHKQSTKLQAGRISQVTNYCPKLLYSGDSTKMQQAMLDLLKNPQNNMQVYKNSELIYSDKDKMSDLEEHFAPWDRSKAISTIVKVIVEILCFKYEYDVQHQFTVLERLKQLQEFDNCHNPPVTNERGYVKLLLNTFIEREINNDARCELIAGITSPLSKHYLSKIVRDCSIMISVKQLPIKSDDVNKYVCVDGIYYLFDVKVFDLFPKDEILS